VQVADLGSFSQAAQQLHMAQPAVSIAVRKLEQSLGVALLDRSGREVLVTAEGREVLQRARRILREAEELRASASDMNQLLRGELGIACPSMLATYYLPQLLLGFLAEHPGLRLAVTQAGTAQVEQMLLQDAVEIGVVSGESDTAELEHTPLIAEQMVVCVRRGHPWAKRSSLAVEELDGAPMVVYESGYFVRRRLDQLCAEHHVSPDYRMQTNFLPLIISMVKQGLGVTVGLALMADQEPGIVGIPLSPAVDIGMALAKRRNRDISRANQAFLDWAALQYDAPKQA
jgi:DNA-binding transcriptional LysR family regulator